jgi:hypothetical protein
MNLEYIKEYLDDTTNIDHFSVLNHTFVIWFKDGRCVEIESERIGIK